MIDCGTSGRRWRGGSIALLLAALFFSSAPTHGQELVGDRPANAATQSIHQETRRILANINKTIYQHSTAINEEQGIYRCDCSGLGLYILNQTVARNDPRGPLGDGRKRPKAVHFENAFAAASTEPNNAGRWQRIERLLDARPGDIIAWRRPKRMPGHTGHVVMVDQTPVKEASGVVRVVVIDSTTRPHADDTRSSGITGIGRGTLWFTIDADGRPVGHIRGAADNEPVIEPIAIGRANEPREATAGGQ